MGSKNARPLLAKMREERGNQCVFCGERENLDFAHLRPTGLRGKGRGMDARATDIRKNPDDYILLCHKCHVIHDRLNPNSTTPKREGEGSRKTDCLNGSCKSDTSW